MRHLSFCLAYLCGSIIQGDPDSTYIELYNIDGICLFEQRGSSGGIVLDYIFYLYYNGYKYGVSLPLNTNIAELSDIIKSSVLAFKNHIRLEQNLKNSKLGG